jgi:hypothetical protein
MKTNPPFRCPHCDSELLRWSSPELSSWAGAHQYVCFNDRCPYFVRGWKWMQEQYQVVASYRFRLDPATGDSGPLPVWSKEAMRDHILDPSKAEGEPTHA